MKKEISDECGEALINNIYMFSVDLSYLIPIYVELILLLKAKNSKLYNELINKIISTATEPFDITDAVQKRLRVGNVLLIGEIFSQNNDIIPCQTVFKIGHYLSNNINLQNQEYIQMLCDLLKKVIPALKDHSIDQLNSLMDCLKQCMNDHSYDKRLRFMIEDVIDLISSD
jgi:hypothetical protein